MSLSNDLLSLKIERDQPEGESSQKKKIARTLLRGVSAAAIVGLAVAAYKVGSPYLEAKFFKAKVDVTEVALVSPTQGAVQLSATGYVVPQVTARVGAKVIGRISKTRVKEGSRVKAGDVLFELDVADQKSAIASAQARYAASVARSGAEHAQIREAQQQLVRDRKLVASGAEAPATAEDLAARVSALRATAHAASADAQAQKAEVMALSVGLGDLTISAPINGTVVTKPAEVGTVANPDVPLAELVDFDSLLIEADVPEAKMNAIKIDAPCEVVLDAAPDRRMRAVVVEVSPKLNRAKATGTVKVKIVDGTDGVLPEMSARVSFLDKPLDANQLAQAAKTVVPSSAIVERGGNKVVFTVDGDRVRIQPVQLGAAFANGFELKNGPAPGTVLVKDPMPTLSDGQEVKRNP